MWVLLVASWPGVLKIHSLDGRGEAPARGDGQGQRSVEEFVAKATRGVLGWGGVPKQLLRSRIGSVVNARE